MGGWPGLSTQPHHEVPNDTRAEITARESDWPLNSKVILQVGLELALGDQVTNKKKIILKLYPTHLSKGTRLKRYPTLSYI